MKVLYFSTKHVHFTLNTETYIEIDGVVMGSPLGPVLANNFMEEPEENIIPTLSKDISLWKRNEDDTICFVKSSCINHVLGSLNSIHSNIKFTIEIEKENQIAFLDILIRNKDLINTTAYHKKTNTDLYIKWKSFSPNNWKWGTLKTLISGPLIYVQLKNTLKMSWITLKQSLNTKIVHLHGYWYSY